MENFKLKFRDWLIPESTVSQFLKDPQKFDPEVVKLAYDAVISIITTQAWTRTISPDKLEFLAKWAAYQTYITYLIGTEQRLKTDRWRYTGTVSQVAKDTIRSALTECGDYLAAMFTGNFAALRGKLNTPSYTLDHLKKDSEYWHIHIASQQRGVGPEGRPVPLQGMPPGWQWVSLDRGYCKKEGDAMGHCGNAAVRDGDNIYSLRDARNVPHLTFIVNNGILGESKGYRNSKPVALLGEDNGQEIVGFIRGGGYKPENNFHFKDLTPEEQKRVLTVKPYIVNFVEYLKNRAGGDPEAAKKLIEDEYNTKFENINFDTGIVIVRSWDDTFEVLKWLKDETRSNLKELPDLEEGFSDWDFNVDIHSALQSFQYSANKKNEAAVDEIVKKLAAQYSEDEEDEEDYDLDRAVEDCEELADALRFSADNAMQVGAEDDAYKSIVNFLKTGDDNFTFVEKPNGGWQLKIGLGELEKLHSEDGESLTDQNEMEYERPNGYDGFDDDAYNDYLADRLSEIDITEPEKPEHDMPLFSKISDEG